MQDGFGRTIDYVRISVTDKCNYRCTYCMPEGGVPLRAHEDLLSAEEIVCFVRLVAREGVSHVRLTGGEPLVSKKILPIVSGIAGISGVSDIALTTNGALLPQLAPQLKAAGLSRVNISLDTLDATQFEEITRLGHVEEALAGIDAALACGLAPVKVNCVVQKSFTQDVFALARLSLDRPVHVRFIEYMPIAGSDAFSGCAAASSHAVWNLHEAREASAAHAHDEAPRQASSATTELVSTHDLLADLNSEGLRCGLGALEPAEGRALPLGVGPANYWHWPHAEGTVGFIGAMSNHFCASCNRMRLTSDGAIRPCLFSAEEYSVREALRAGDDATVLETWHEALAHKPAEHGALADTNRFMSQIGG